jgi:5-hydroxyisourate hydrolase-like protein (transthyretin family)
MAYVPKNQTEAVQKYTREYINADGTVSTWHYDRTITTAGPYKVEHKYTKQFFDSLKEKKVAKKKKNS